MPRTTPIPILLLLLATGCGGDEPDGAGGDAADAPASGQEPGTAAGDGEEGRTERPEQITDTISIEGTQEPITLQLYRTPDDFPLEFSTYIPEEMGADVSGADESGGASVRFFAEFGGVRNELAFVHVFVHPAGTDVNEALAVVRAYEAGHGLPVSRGLEPLDDPGATDRMPWAVRAYRFEYQSGGQWYLGTIGLGQHDGRIFHVVQHYPAEYGDGFGPRASPIMESWRWADGTELM